MKIITNEEYELLIIEMREIDESMIKLLDKLTTIKSIISERIKHTSDGKTKAWIDCPDCGGKTLHAWCGCNIKCQAFYCLTTGCEAEQNEVNPLTADWQIIEKE